MAKPLVSDLPLRKQLDVVVEEIRFASSTPSSSSDSDISLRIDGWTKHRALIEKLYIDSQWKLDEVRRFMEKEHGHLGSTKQYKTHFKAWNIRKNVKKEEALFVMSKKNTRDAIGRKSEFRLRGKPVSVDNVVRYLQRKGIPDPRTAATIERVRTPPSFSVRTPSPSPPASPSHRSPSAPSIDRSTLYPSTLMSGDAMAEYANDQADLEEIRQYLATIDEATWTSMDLSKEAEILAMVTAPLPSLANPSKYRTPENLFFNINLYLLGTFESNLFVHTYNGQLTRSRPPPPEIYRFQDNWGTGLNMIRNGLHAQGRAVFAQVCDLAVKMFYNDSLQIFNHQDPYWMRCVIHLYRSTVTAQPTLGKHLLRHMSQTACKLLPNGHPWREIFTAMGAIDEEILDVLMRSWDMYNELTAHRFSRLDEEYISSWFGYAFWCKSPVELEAQIYAMWQLAVTELPRNDRRISFLGYHYAGAKANMGKLEEALLLFQRQLEFVEETGHDGHRFLVLERLAMCHNDLGEVVEAECRIKQAVELARDQQWEEQMQEAATILRKWLRDWGRHEDAKALGLDGRIGGFVIPLDDEDERL
ncbi:hypothetical protein P154DRAFT_566051 [Amniculicola lignicola CBS 123094]|uniref:Clr5 domain-containing protein n=1 Tax=Amniculicola lignicola CBS 123094 TaxID=1392246 RepID=A0A6A5W3K7_9PLEO|nr:hypothetical protein P154DRAFT_566051 [Amniculicola lignicola CBS 123094]